MIIYLATNKLNDKVYVGQTIKSLQNRINRHLYRTIKTNSKLSFHCALRKYGIENFEFHILENCNSIEMLNEREKFYIKEYNSFKKKYGYNSTTGGNNFFLSEDAKRKIAIKAIGRKQSKETIEKRVSKLRGKKHSDETLRKMSLSKLGKKFSTEHRKNIGISKSGSKHPLYGKHAFTYKKLDLDVLKKMYFIDKLSFDKIAIIFGCNRKTISRRIHGEVK